MIYLTQIKKFIILFFVFLNINLYALNGYDLFNQQSNSSIQKSDKEKKDNFKWTKDFAKNILSDYPFLMGVSKKEFNNKIDKYMNDNFWEKANEYFYDKNKYKKYGNIKIPDIKKVLAYLDYSSKNGNELAAFQGSVIILKIFSGYLSIMPKYILKKKIKEKELKYYYKDYIKVLLNKKYCYAYSQALKYYGYIAQNIDKAYNIGLEGVKVCKKQLDDKKIPKWMDIGMRNDFVKFKINYDLYHNPKYIDSIKRNRDLK